jgi:hypothetical protein
MEARNCSLEESWKPTSEIRELILRDMFLVGRDRVDILESCRAGEGTGILEAGLLVAEVGD